MEERIGISKLSQYLRVAPPTTRRFVIEKRLPTLGRLQKQPTFAWDDILCATGVDNPEQVSPEHREALKAPLLNAAEVARLLQLPEHGEKRIRERANEGVLPAIRVGKQLRFRRCDILRRLP